VWSNAQADQGAHLWHPLPLSRRVEASGLMGQSSVGRPGRWSRDAPRSPTRTSRHWEFDNPGPGDVLELVAIRISGTVEPSAQTDGVARQAHAIDASPDDLRRRSWGGFLRAALDIQRAVLRSTLRVEVVPAQGRRVAWTSDRLRLSPIM
jgi:hypothetical protein